MTALVTGARGAFARALVPKLEESLQTDVVQAVRHLGNRSSEVECDLSDRHAVENMISRTKPKLIYHLAGSFAGDFETDILVNAYSSKWIFDELIRLNLDCRVVVIGSAAEYGMVSESANPVSETHPLNPVSVYGLTKVMQTQIAKYYASTHGIDVVVARVFNLAGEGLSQRLFYGRLLSMVDLYKRKEIEKLSFGNLDAVRDYVDFDQAIEQIISIANRGVKGDVYNVGSGVPVRMKDLLNKVLVENNIPLGCVESVAQYQKRSGDVPVIYADIKKVSALRDQAT